jgi:hypothetical protein
LQKVSSIYKLLNAFEINYCGGNIDESEEFLGLIQKEILSVIDHDKGKSSRG